MVTIAIIGAGIAGLTAANLLDEHAASITIFEKARGVSGRCTTRYADPYQFDHGAQYFTAKTSEFQQFLAPYIADGVVTPWSPSIVELSPHHSPKQRIWEHPHYVGTPKMNDFPKKLAEGLDVRLQTRIATVSKGDDDRWELYDSANNFIGTYDWVISTAPPAQNAALLPASLSFHHDITHAKMDGCFTVMLGFDNDLSLPFDAAYCADSIIDWIALNHKKPQRQTSHSLVMHSTSLYAEQHIEHDASDLMQDMLDALALLIPHKFTPPTYTAAHKWRYARVQHACDHDYLIDEAAKISACGDWCNDGRIEAAFMSSYLLSARIIRAIS